MLLLVNVSSPNESSYIDNFLTLINNKKYLMWLLGLCPAVLWGQRDSVAKPKPPQSCTGGASCGQQHPPPPPRPQSQQLWDTLV